MAETSKNKIYYNDNENSVADVLADMKKMAESTDEAIENSKYNDAAIKKSISDVEKKQVEKNTEQDSKIVELQTEKAKLETELKEMQEDFYQNSIRGQASGEYIHVEDSSNCRAKIGIGGNSEQETRSGKNLYNVNDMLKITKSTVDSEDYITTTLDNSSATSSSYANIYTNKSDELKVSTAYKIICEIKSITGTGNLQLYTLAGGDTSSTSQVNLNSAVLPFSSLKAGQILNYIIKTIDDFSSAKSMLRTLVFFNAGQSGSITFRISVLEDTTATTDNFVYEKHGAMPSPDYPSEIKTVGSNVNIFDKDNSNIKNWYIDTSNKKIASGNSENRILIQEIKPNTTYTISKKLSTFIVATCTNMPTLNSSTTQAQRNDNATKITIASGSSDKYLVVQFKTQADTLTEQEILDSIKIVEGTEVREYSKFGQGCVKVTKCNENILDTSITKNVKNQNGEERIGYFCRITKTGTYYLMLNTANTLYFGKSTDLNSATTLIGSTSSTFSTTYDFNEGEYFVLWGTKTEKDKIMVILSNKQQKYIEHQEQSYIMPIQKEILQGDYFDFDNEEEVHIFGKKVLTGNENWEAIGTNTSGKYRFQTKVDDIAFNTDGNTYLEGICDSYKVGTPITTYLCQESIATVQNYLIIYNEKVNDTVENFEKGLSNKNVTIYYKLATPQRIAFTEEQKAVAKELNNARTYKNVTNIYSTDKISPIIDLDYAKDLETLLTSKESEV